MHTHKLERDGGSNSDLLHSVANDVIAVLEQGDGVNELIEDADEVRELLESFATQAVEARVRMGAGSTRARIVRTDHGELRWEAQLDLRDGVGFAEFCGPHAVYGVLFPPSSDAPALPTWVRRTIRRRRRRSKALGTTLRIESRDTDFGFVEYAVRDVSREGLSFEAPADAPLWAGRKIAMARLTQGAREAAVEIHIQNARRSAEGGALVVGATFAPLSRVDGAIAQRIVMAALYPTTRAADGEVWALHEASGYLELSGKSPGDFEHLRAGHVEFLQKVEPHPNVAVNLCWPSAGLPLATVSNLKPYSSTWLFCHVSKRREVPPEQGRLGLSDLYLRAYEAAQNDADTRWVMTYVQDRAPSWSRLVHVDVPQRYARTGEGCLLPFHALELDVARTAELPRPSSRSVAQRADGADAKRAIRALCRVRPAQYLDALDLTETRWDLSSTSTAWRKAGLERERQLYVAWERDTPSALAVCELAGPHAHIFGLLDCVRMYPLRPGGVRAFDSLLDAAHLFFAERGRASFVYFREFPDRLLGASHAYRDLGSATLTLLAVERIPELMNRVGDLAAPRPRREERDLTGSLA